MADVMFTDQNFQEEVLNSKTPVLVDFWAPWCGPCKIVSPIIDELATSYEGKVKVGKMNVDENPNVSSDFNIMSIPTVVIFKGGKPVSSIVGAQPKENYKKHLDEVSAS